ncbi:hypothetical protein [Pilimelia columellifera]|uniref:hypothetical protein n=1 Tax=Pilimelia columellifera TaxID=706574 RepID=UPI0031D0F623
MDLEVDAFDPEEMEPEGVHLEINEDMMFQAFYAPYARAVEFASHSLDGQEVVLSGDLSNGTQVRLHKAIYLRTTEADDGRIEGMAEDIRDIHAAIQTQELGLRPDGTALVADWVKELSLSDWEG